MQQLNSTKIFQDLPLYNEWADFTFKLAIRRGQEAYEDTGILTNPQRPKWSSYVNYINTRLRNNHQDTPWTESFAFLYGQLDSGIWVQTEQLQMLRYLLFYFAND